MRWPSTEIVETSTVLPSQVSTGVSDSSARYPSRCSAVGISFGGKWLISALVMNDVATICTSGSTNSSASGISSRCQG